MPIYEFCAENVTFLEKAFEAGAQRVELCDNLAVGDTTPSIFCIDAPLFVLFIQKSRILVADTAILSVFQNILRPINYEESLKNKMIVSLFMEVVI